MLQSIRDRAQGWLAWVIVGLIIIPFALWGIQEYIGGGTEVNVASVNDTDITLGQFQQSFEQQRQRVRSLLGDNSDQFDEAKIKQDVMTGLIENEVLRQSTGEFGLRVTDVQLAQEIQGMQTFQTNGQFSKETFTELLRRQGLTPARFESLVRDGLLTQQLKTGITSLALVTQGELDEAMRLKNQQRQIGYLIVPSKRFEAGLTIDEASIKNYFEENRNNLVNPEQVSIEYLELSASELARNVKVDEQELRKLYEERRTNFLQPGQRRVSQIVIPISKNAELQEVATATTRANALRKRIQAGEDFASLARELSTDTATASKGGDLGLVTRGSLSPDLEEQIFSMKLDEVSQPVQGPDGFYLLKLTEIKPDQSKPFADVRAELEVEYRQTRGEELYFEKAEPLTNMVFENPDTLSIAAKELGLAVKSSALFSRAGGAGITGEAKVISAAFSEEVLEQGFNSEPVEIADKHLIVLRLKEHKEASMRSLDQERQAITARLRSNMAQDKARTFSMALEKQLTQGADPAALARQNELEWIKTDFIDREASSLQNPAIISAAFKLPKPLKASDSSIGSERLATGDYAVIKVYAVKEGMPETLAAPAQLALRRQLQRARAEDEYQSFVEELKQDTSIIVHQDKLL